MKKILKEAAAVVLILMCAALVGGLVPLAPMAEAAEVAS